MAITVHRQQDTATATGGSRCTKGHTSAPDIYDDIPAHATAFVLCTEPHLLDLLSECLCDLWMGMAHNGRPPAAHIVHVLRWVQNSVPGLIGYGGTTAGDKLDQQTFVCRKYAKALQILSEQSRLHNKVKGRKQGTVHRQGRR